MYTPPARPTSSIFRARATSALILGGTLALLGCGAPESDGTGAVSPGEQPGESTAGVCRGGRPSGVRLDGRNVIGGDMVLLPSCKKSAGEAIGLNGRHVLFANFDGADVRSGDSALENQGLRAADLEDKGVIELDAFAPGSSSRMADILKIQKQLAAWYSATNVDVVISRPLSGDYLMSIVGDRQSSIVQMDGVVGISPLDCKNTRDSNLNYSFSGSLKENVDQTAVTIAHEAGHAFGLVHTLNNKDIMFPSVSMVDGFGEGPIANPGACGFKSGERTDSLQTLITNLGARKDPPPGRMGDAPPKLTLLSPQDGTTIGNDVTIAVKAESALGIDRVTLSVTKIEGKTSRGGHPVAELRPPASSAQVKFSLAGNYQITATGYDRLGNIGLTQIQVTVSTPTCGKPNDCAPGQKCQNNTCVTPPLSTMPPTMGAGMEDSLRPFGTACDTSSECKGGICAITPIGQICTHYCTPEYLCADGLECVDGICEPSLYPRTTPKLGQLGGKCTRNQDCSTGECSTPGADPLAPRYCTKSCDPEVAWSCPATMSCTMSDAPTGMKNRCLQKPAGQPGNNEEGGGGGCHFGASHVHAEASPAASAAALLLFAGFALLSRRRDRRRS